MIIPLNTMHVDSRYRELRGRDQSMLATEALSEAMGRILSREVVRARNIPNGIYLYIGSIPLSS